MKKILSLILTLCLVLALCAGCASGVDSSKTETYNLSCGATITAPSGLKETEIDGFTDALDSKVIALLLLEEARPADYTLADYAYLVALNNGMSEGFTEDAYGNLAATYTAESGGETCTTT